MNSSIVGCSIIAIFDRITSHTVPSQSLQMKDFDDIFKLFFLSCFSGRFLQRNRSMATHRRKVNSLEQLVQLLHREAGHRAVFNRPDEAGAL